MAAKCGRDTTVGRPAAALTAVELALRAEPAEDFVAIGEELSNRRRASIVPAPATHDLAAHRREGLLRHETDVVARGGASAGARRPASSASRRTTARNRFGAAAAAPAGESGRRRCRVPSDMPAAKNATPAAVSPILAFRARRRAASEPRLRCRAETRSPCATGFTQVGPR